MATASYKLTYFDVQGRAELIRMLLRFGNVEFEDVRVDYPQWVQSTGKPKYEELPILEIDGKAIAQSQVIARYLARKLGYLPTDPDAGLEIDELYTFINSDISDRQMVGALFQDAEAKEKYRADYWENYLPKKLALIEKILEGNTTGFLIGDKWTLADLCLVDFAQRVLYDKQWAQRAEPILAKFTNLAGYLQKRFEDPQYKAYVEKKPKQN